MRWRYLTGLGKLAFLTLLGIVCFICYAGMQAWTEAKMESAVRDADQLRNSEGKP